MGIKDILNSGKIKTENEELKKLYEEMGGKDIIDINAVLKDLESKKLDAQKALNTLSQQAATLEDEISNKKAQVIVLDNTLMYESFALYTPNFQFSNSDEYKAKLDALREEQKKMLKNNIAATGNQNWAVNNSQSQGKKMVNDMMKLVLRSFNNECDYCVDNVKFNTLESHLKRIKSSFESLNKLGQIMQVSISVEYLTSKINELYLAYEYQLKKQEEKEEQKRIREELREQAKLEQEIKQARDKIAKERKHFNKALDEIKAKIQTTTDENEIKMLNEKMNEFQTSIAELDKEESLVDYREKNAKAGYVYIISNIGAFGENVFKIGMTRRLEPMERVDELGDASVPFSFDVHALIFSENAPELETKLHQHFYKNRINKRNNRKEFFKADIKEIEKVIKENYDKVLDVIEIAPAEQFRQSLLINE